MKTIIDAQGTGKEVLAQFAKVQKKKRKSNDPAIRALKAASASLATAGAADRVHVSVAIAEHETEPPFKADVSIVAAVPTPRTP